jgi:hypothetical protein
VLSPIVFSLAMAFSCPQVKVVNRTSVWSSEDDRMLEFNKTRCVVSYENYPCLKVFDKREENTYRALCGKPD